MKAIITGANSGIGEALANLLEGKGYDVIRANRALCDLSKSRTELVVLIRKEVPDLVVNCAGFGLYGPAVDLSTQEQLELFEVNAKAVYEITVEAAKALIEAKKPGTICNVSSAAAFLHFPHFTAYAASKACVNHFSQSLDLELKSKGIRVLAACPGQVATPFRYKAAKGKRQRSTSFAMAPEKAARLIYKQILKQKKVYLFDSRTRLAIWLARCVPGPLLAKRLRASIDKRT